MPDPLNQLMPLEAVMRPDDVLGLRRDYPSLIEALKVQQTVINQLIVRAGGSGGGGNVVNLDEITANIEELDEITDTSSPALFHAEHALNEAQAAIIMASDNNLMAQFAELRSRIEAIEFYAGDVQLIAQIADLRARIEALENVSNA